MIVTFTVLTFGLSSRAFCKSFKAFAMFSIFSPPFVLSDYIIPRFNVFVNGFFENNSKNSKKIYYMRSSGRFFYALKFEKVRTK